MENQELFQYIDHTQLNPCADWKAIQKLCAEALRYGTASVCIPPCYVGRVHAQYPDLNICTVVGFPLGYSVTEAKATEVRMAVLEGASEIDMVINLAWVKNGKFAAVEEEIRTLRKAAEGKILKVIVETCYLTEEEKIALCRAVTAAGADYIKTSTGFGSTGAALEDIALFKKHIGPEVKIKAAGGIRSREALERFVEAGCGRIGTSSAAVLLAKENENGL